MSNKQYWLISAPAIGKERNVEQVARRVGSLAVAHNFDVPDLKVGTLDALMSLSDDLGKHDNFLEAVTKKIANQLFMLFEATEHQSLLQINGSNPDHYLTHFRWDEAKYPIKSSCREIIDTINSQVTKLDEELRVKASDYSSILHTLAQADRGQTGNLFSRDLADIVKQDDWHETEYLTTLFVAVPKYSLKEWDNCYETLTEFVLPRSSKIVQQDNDFALVSVCLFKRDVPQFKEKAAKLRFTVRDFVFNAEKIKAGKEEKLKLSSEKDQKKNKLVLWCKTNFGEAFVAWMHLKSIRVFVESILRFGLPANFQAVLVLPNKRDDKKVRTALHELFKHLATKHLDEGVIDDEGVLSSETFYPYVSLTINTEMHPDK